MNDVRFQIIDKCGNVVDQNLSYDEALMWIDQPFGNRFTMEVMKEDEQK